MSVDYTTNAMTKLKESMISTDQKYGGGALNTRRSVDPGSIISFAETNELGD